MRICIYSDFEQDIILRSLEIEGEKNDIESYGISFGKEEDSIFTEYESLPEERTKFFRCNIKNSWEFIKECGISKAIIPFDLDCDLINMFDHINVYGNNYFMIGVKKDFRSKKYRDKIKKKLGKKGVFIPGKSYGKHSMEFIEFLYQFPVEKPLSWKKTLFLGAFISVLISILNPIVINIFKLIRQWF